MSAPSNAATREDLDQLRLDLKQDLHATREDLDQLRLDLKTDVAGLKTDVAGLKQDLERFATKQDLERFATKQDLERYATKQDLERFATKQDLETWGMALAARIDTLQTEMRREIRANRIDLGVDLVRHVRAMDEQHRAELGVVDEKYADLPARVKALEDR